MKAVYAHEKFPEPEEGQSIFLAGPTPRKQSVISWRVEALKILKEVGYDGYVFIPEPRDGVWRGDYHGQIEWEQEGLSMADCILFWIPRDIETLPGFTTNVEFGMYLKSDRIVLGSPKSAPKMKYLRFCAKNCNILQAETLRETICNALKIMQIK